MKALTYLLVDFENVQPPASDISLMQGNAVHLWIFRGPHQKNFSAELVETWQPLGKRVRFVQSSKPGKNALDFHIAFSLGRLAQENQAAARPATYVVVSRDEGFEPLFDHIRKVAPCVIGKAASIPAALALADTLSKSLPVPEPARSHGANASPQRDSPDPKPPKLPQTAKPAKKATTPPRTTPAADDAEKVIADLRAHPKNRPADRKALQRHIVSILKNKITPEVSEVLVNALEQQHVVKFNGSKAEYKIPKAKK
ncbi:MAG: PIN domain-containing protein [Gammaproteobacteria bacterium]